MYRFSIRQLQVACVLMSVVFVALLGVTLFLNIFPADQQSVGAISSEDHLTSPVWEACGEQVVFTSVGGNGQNEYLVVLPPTHWDTVPTPEVFTSQHEADLYAMHVAAISGPVLIEKGTCQVQGVPGRKI